MALTPSNGISGIVLAFVGKLRSVSAQLAKRATRSFNFPLYAGALAGHTAENSESAHLHPSSGGGGPQAAALAAGNAAPKHHAALDLHSIAASVAAVSQAAAEAADDEHAIAASTPSALDANAEPSSTDASSSAQTSESSLAEDDREELADSDESEDEDGEFASDEEAAAGGDDDDVEQAPCKGDCSELFAEQTSTTLPAEVTQTIGAQPDLSRSPQQTIEQPFGGGASEPQNAQFAEQPYNMHAFEPQQPQQPQQQPPPPFEDLIVAPRPGDQTDGMAPASALAVALETCLYVIVYFLALLVLLALCAHGSKLQLAGEPNVVDVSASMPHPHHRHHHHANVAPMQAHI